VNLGSWTWQVNTAFVQDGLLQRLRTPEELMRPPAEVIERVPPRVRTQLVRVALPQLPGTPLVIKRYFATEWRQACKDWFRRSRARRAFETAFALRNLELPTAVPIAAGERRSGRWLREAYLVSAEVPAATTAYQFYVERADRRQRLVLVRSLARTMAALHDAGFTHFDPHPLNFLVSGGDCRRLVMIDLDAVRRCVWFTERTAVKDLRRMTQRSPLGSREQLWFLAQYARARASRPPARALLAALRSA
jgi:tRNA A-37 threonylcarbamoyl transferase component Bud32